MQHVLSIRGWVNVIHSSVIAGQYQISAGRHIFWGRVDGGITALTRRATQWTWPEHTRIIEQAQHELGHRQHRVCITRWHIQIIAF